MKHILCCVDFSPVTDRVLTTCADLAHSLGATVTLLHVAPPDPEFVGYGVGPQSVRDSVAAQLRSTHSDVQRLAEGLREGGLEVTPLTVQGATVERIVDHAARLRADLLVLGSHGRGLMFELLVGSVAHGVLRQATVPVVVVPAPRG